GSTFHDHQRDHPGDDLRQARSFGDSDDVLHVLVGTGGLFDDPRAGRRVDVDPAPLEGLEDLARRIGPRRGLPRHLAAGPVPAGAERLFHRGRLADEDEGAGAHVAGDEDRLPHVPVGRRRLRVTGREGPGGTLAVHEDLAPTALRNVFLDLADVVTHVVDDPHPEGVRGTPADVREGVPHPEGDQLPAVPREVRAAAHGLPVVLSFLRADGGAGQLWVVQLDLLQLHDPFAYVDVVRRDLV